MSSSEKHPSFKAQEDPSTIRRKRSGDSYVLSIPSLRKRVIWKLMQLRSRAVRELDLTLRSIRIHLDSGRTRRFVITQWYGRAGNNIQQILIIALHAETFSGSISVTREQLSKAQLTDLFLPFSLHFGPPGRSEAPAVLRRFFHFTEYTFHSRNSRRAGFSPGVLARRDSLLRPEQVQRQLQRVAHQHLLRHLRVIEPKQIAGDRLLLHLRSGDIGALNHPTYLVNPLWYYRQLALLHQDVLVVTEPGRPHPLLEEIRSLFSSIQITSGTMAEDFTLLRSCRQLATSGVGTFAVAAALLSTELKGFHCSDLYLSEHLNPAMLDPARVRVRMIRLPGFVDCWRRSDDRITLLREWQPPQGSPAAVDPRPSSGRSRKGRRVPDPHL